MSLIFPDCTITAAVRAGSVLDVIEGSSGDGIRPAMGDLVRLGLASRHYLTDAEGDVEAVFWRNLSPITLRVGGRLVPPQSYTGDVA